MTHKTLTEQQMGESYIDTIFRISEPYLLRDLDAASYAALKRRTKKLQGIHAAETVEEFSRVYRDIVKKSYQNEYPFADLDLERFISKKSRNVKAVWGDSLQILKSMSSESVHLMVTSPPYYNAREYSQWDNLDDYLKEMKTIIQEAYRVLDNHRAFVFNVGDITGNDHLHTRSSWGTRRIPLGAYFIQIFEDVGFTFIDDIIWDKGEVQSQRHKNGDTPSPLYQYPVNCYEHILVFHKHRNDTIRYPCPVCGCLKVNGNACSGKGIKSWECKNLDCFERSAANRGKRFSLRSIVMSELKKNIIDTEFIKKWRKDIIQLQPVIKINSKGENILGHTAPFPTEIPEFAIKTLTGVNEIVIDPFAGSFTTAIKAIELDRVGVGFELNKKMFSNSVKANIEKNGYSLEEISWP